MSRRHRSRYSAPSAAWAESAAGWSGTGSGRRAASSTACAAGLGCAAGGGDPEELLPGDAVDFWRVEELEPGRLLRLRAEMQVPGKAWLQWEAVPEGGGTRLLQTALFAPKGAAGSAYWYSLYPIHRFIFSDMVRAIARAAERAAGEPAARPSSRH